jgi:hypothetical protein
MDYYLNKNIGNDLYKYTLSFDIPFTQSQCDNICTGICVEGIWAGFADFNPFAIYRSVWPQGFLPMFGLLGLDWLWIDPVGIPSANGSQFHFSINSSID